MRTLGEFFTLKYFKIQLSLQLEENSSEYSLFKILPCYKYQNELDKFIKFSDDIYIASALENINKDAYLALATKINNETEGSQLLKPEAKLGEESDDEDINDGLDNINDDFIIAFEKTTKFKFIFYKTIFHKI